MIQRTTEKRKDRGEKGFTLIELLVVIVILGILAAVVVFAVGGVGDKGNESACTIDTRTLRTSAEAHFANEGNYTVASPAWDGVANPRPSAAGDELALVTRGFLSEVSPLHNFRVVDTNASNTVNTPGIEILVEDGGPPGNDCGTKDGLVGQDSTDGSGPAKNK